MEFAITSAHKKRAGFGIPEALFGVVLVAITTLALTAVLRSYWTTKQKTFSSTQFSAFSNLIDKIRSDKLSCIASFINPGLQPGSSPSDISLFVPRTGIARSQPISIAVGTVVFGNIMIEAIQINRVRVAPSQPIQMYNLFIRASNGGAKFERNYKIPFEVDVATSPPRLRNCVIANTSSSGGPGVTKRQACEDIGGVWKSASPTGPTEDSCDMIEPICQKIGLTAVVDTRGLRCNVISPPDPPGCSPEYGLTGWCGDHSSVREAFESTLLAPGPCPRNQFMVGANDDGTPLCSDPNTPPPSRWVPDPNCGRCSLQAVDIVGCPAVPDVPNPPVRTKYQIYDQGVYAGYVCAGGMVVPPPPCSRGRCL